MSSTTVNVNHTLVVNVVVSQATMDIGLESRDAEGL